MPITWILPPHGGPHTGDESETAMFGRPAASELSIWMARPGTILEPILDQIAHLGEEESIMTPARTSNRLGRRSSRSVFALRGRGGRRR